MVTASVTDASNNPVPDAIVRFSVTSGPHAGFTLPVGTGDGNNGTTLGLATFTYTDTLGTAARIRSQPVLEVFRRQRPLK